MEIAYLGIIYDENFEDEISYARFSRKKKKIFREFRLVIDV
jgi:hypothetical protein